MQCMSCYTGDMIRPDNGHVAYIYCPACGAIELTYEPQDYQQAVHSIPIVLNESGSPQPQIIFVAGGYGSGKSRVSLQEFFIRCLENPNGTSVITAPTLQQLKRTSIKTLFNEIIPPPLVESYNKTDMEIVLINGHTIYAVPSNDEERLRSLNIGQFHLEEASGVDKSIYVQLLTRLRDPFTKVKTAFVCTNPSSNWVRDTFAVNDDRKDEKHPEHDEYNPFIHTFIWPTHLNKYLPDNFAELTTAGRPEWWRRKYLEGSFDFNEGAVYPMFSNTIIEPFEVTRDTDKYGIPKHWERFVGMDVGLRNPTAVLFGAINPENGEVIIYNEYYVAGKTVPEHAQAIKPLVDEIPSGLLRFMVADPAFRNRTDIINGKSAQALYQEYGLYFSPGNNQIEAGVLKVNSYIERGKLKIYKTCVNLLKEGINYVFPELDIDDDRNPDEKPVKKNDHAVDSLRYMLMRLPDDPDRLHAESATPPSRYDDDDDDWEEENISSNYLNYV